MDEEALIEAVLRVRLTGAETAAQAHAALEGEGLEVTMSQVKKASSKATKRLGEQPAPAVTELSKPSAAKETKLAKQAASQEKAKNAELKSAENAMMEAHPKLRGLTSGDPSAPITANEHSERPLHVAAIKGGIEDAKRLIGENNAMVHGKDEVRAAASAEGRGAGRQGAGRQGG